MWIAQVEQSYLPAMSHAEAAPAGVLIEISLALRPASAGFAK